MQRKHIPVITMLFAGAVTCVVSIVNQIDTLLSLEILLGVLIIFYIVGIFARFAISKILDSGTIPVEETKEMEEEQPERSTGETDDFTEEEETLQEE